MLAEGTSYSAIKQRLRTTAPTISRWKRRFLASGIDGLDAYHPRADGSGVDSGTASQDFLGYPEKAEGWLYPLELPEARLDTGRQQGRYPSRMKRGWFEAASLWERYMASDDPEFESKAADIIRLYLNAPQHAAVFCFDEKTAIRALDRRDPVLPLSRMTRRAPWF
jgi:hypothetical protein